MTRSIYRRPRAYDRRVPFEETCSCCLALAPSWSSEEYADWCVLITEDGECVGVACSGCVADEELLVFELEADLLAA